MTAFQNFDRLMQERRLVEAGSLAEDLIREYPDSVEAWIRLGHLQELMGDFHGMGASFAQILSLEPDNLMAALKVAVAHIRGGDVAPGLSALKAIEKKASDDVCLLQEIGELYTHLSAFDEAFGCYSRAAACAPDDPQVLYNLAAATTAMGDLGEAERLYDRVIALSPQDYDAYYNRSVLRRWTKHDNHIEVIEGLLKAGIPDRAGAVQLFYALAKEYEDLGLPDPSFAHLQRGANLRASMLAYSVEQDTRAMAQIASVFDATFCAEIPAATTEPGPIFIVGLPRTGTTLVDRIFSSHSDVESFGEINDLAMTISRLAGAAKNKADLIAKAATIDFETLGQLYEAGTRGRGALAPYLVDKTPANFLYIGLIAKAMPNAKIIHLRRGAMDSCYAIYKTLFRMGYPYSYRLDDLAKYYAAYDRLMQHWRTAMPGRILDVSYEDLVTDLEGQAKEMLAHCGLDLQPACLDFHKNKSATATASAAQVREPVHQRSIKRWKDYELELRPLKDALEREGISL